MRADLSPEVIRQYLAKFRFFGDDPFRQVRGLSGGERSRLAMAKIMLFPRNVLVLDEPTNHLDIPARETLEDALRQLRRHADRRQPRSLFPRPRLHAPAGDRRRPAGGAPRQLQRLAPPSPRRQARRDRRPSKPTAAKAGGQARFGAPPRSRDADKDRERERRRLARRVETLEADVSKLEGRAGRRPRRTCRQITAATGKSCTPWPIANGSSTPCSPSGWPSGKPPARRSSTSRRHPPIDSWWNPICGARFGVARRPSDPILIV